MLTLGVPLILALLDQVLTGDNTKHRQNHLPAICFPWTLAIFIPEVTIDGVTTLIPETGVVVVLVVPGIFWVAAAAAARAAIPVIWPPAVV